MKQNSTSTTLLAYKTEIFPLDAGERPFSERQKRRKRDNINNKNSKQKET
jgi:hypothetical protein